MPEIINFDDDHYRLVMKAIEIHNHPNNLNKKGEIVRFNYFENSILRHAGVMKKDILGSTEAVNVAEGAGVT